MRRIQLHALMFVLVAAAACSGGGGDSPPAVTPTAVDRQASDTIVVRQGEKLRIGVSAALSTEQAQFGVPIRDAALLAVRGKEQVHGFEIEILAEDDTCTGPGAEAVAQRLTAANAVAVVGPMCPSGVLAAMDDYANAGLVMISSSASHASLSAQGATNFVRTIWSDSVEADEIARYAFTTLGVRRALLIHDRSPRGEALINTVEASLKSLGADVPRPLTLTPGGTTHTELVRTVIASDVQIVIIGGLADEGALLAEELVAAGYAGIIFGAGSEASDAPWLGIEGAYVSRGPVGMTSTYNELLAAYRATYGDQAGTSYIEYTYDALQVLFGAIERTALVSGTGDLTIDRQALIDAVKTSRLEGGASGIVAFEPDGDRDPTVGAVNATYQVRDGAFVRVQ